MARVFFYLLLPCFCVLAACGVGERQADLKITYLKDGEKSQTAWSCRGQACTVLNEIAWQPVLPGQICAEGYGGTDLLFIRGQVNGQEVDSRFQKTNVCELRRFASVEKLLQTASLKRPTEKERLASVSSLLHFPALSNRVASALTFLGLPLISAILLAFLTLAISFYFWGVAKLARARRFSHLIFALILPPLAPLLAQITSTEKSFSFSLRFLLDGALMTTSFFLPWPLSPAFFVAIIIFELKYSFSLREGKDSKISDKGEEKDN
jgi:hypothetical protein